MTATSAIASADWIETAKSLAGAIASYRDEGESLRQMAPALFEVIRETGIFDMLVPASLGGPQADYEDYLRVVEEVSCLDGSAGWNVMIWAAKGLFADYLPNETAAELIGPGKVVCGAINPTGQAVPEPGGFRVSGRWAFASGCHYADWLIAAFTVMDGEAPRLLDNGAPDM